MSYKLVSRGVSVKEVKEYKQGSLRLFSGSVQELQPGLALVRGDASSTGAEEEELCSSLEAGHDNTYNQQLTVQEVIEHDHLRLSIYQQYIISLLLSFVILRQFLDSIMLHY